MHWVSPLLVVLRYGRYSLCWGPIVALYIFSPSHLIFVSFFPRPKFIFFFCQHLFLFFPNTNVSFSTTNVVLFSIVNNFHCNDSNKFVNTQVIELCAHQGMDGEVFFFTGRGGARPKVYWTGMGPKSAGQGGAEVGSISMCSIIGFLYWKDLRIWPLFCPVTPVH